MDLISLPINVALITLLFCYISQGNMEAAYSLFEQAIAIEKGKENSQTLPVLFAQYARFTYLVGYKLYKL